MTEWKVYQATIRKSQEAEIPIIARSYAEAHTMAEDCVGDVDWHSYDQGDSEVEHITELTEKQAIRFYGQDIPWPSEDLPEYLKDKDVPAVFEELRKRRKLLPGTDEYQEHWESLGQQRMFERGGN